MEIVKSFNENNLHTDIVIRGTTCHPLFRASDIGIILDITNINKLIKDYDETEKILLKHNTKNGIHEINFLTEEGLYNVLFTSRKPIAKQFKKWVCSVIKEIRLKGKYELENKIKEQENELKEYKKELELKDEELEKKQTLLEKSKIEKSKEIEKTIIKQFPINTECIYIGTIENTNESNEKLIKFGHTNELSTRVTCHHKNYDNFVLIHAFRVQNKVEIENLIKSHEIIKKQIRTIKVNDKNKTEIIAYDDVNFTIEKLVKIIKDIIQTKIYSIENFNKLLKRNDELEDIQRNIDEKIKNLENELNEHTKKIKEQNIEIIYLKEKIDEKQKIIDNVDNENESVYKNVLLPEDDLNKKFDEFIKEICIVRPDVEEKSVNIEGRYRLWAQVKPKKEVFHALKNYLDIRFKGKKINGIHSYIGIKLKNVEYKKNDNDSDVQRFIFNSCNFSDTAKILNSTLLKEYQKWKISLDKEISNDDMKDLKKYLNESPYTLKATVWKDNESNEGYYGIELKIADYKPKYNNTTGKKVYKIELKSNLLLSTYDSILNASLYEDISRASMSRCVKNKTVFKNDYYYTSELPNIIDESNDYYYTTSHTDEVIVE
jgi:prophage antirepressor-like protein/5-hydroxyisourate hydrolase-like protein (transthyretin family)